jgi:hypothetical protein
MSVIVIIILFVLIEIVSNFPFVRSQREKGTNRAGCYSLAFLSNKVLKLHFCVSLAIIEGMMRTLKFHGRHPLTCNVEDRQVTDRSASSHRIYLELFSFKLFPFLESINPNASVLS